MTNLVVRPKSLIVGNKIPAKKRRLLQLLLAAEVGIPIEFNDGFEARFYREAYIKTHTGVIDAEVIEKTKLIGKG